VQEAIYREVPYIRVGNFAALSGLSGKLKGFAPMPIDRLLHRAPQRAALPRIGLGVEGRQRRLLRQRVVYVTHSAFLPEPMLTPPQLGDGAPGWWDTLAKKAALPDRSPPAPGPTARRASPDRSRR
jgi:hypothetical protein